MLSQTRLASSPKRTIRAATVTEAVAGLRVALATGPQVMIIELCLVPTLPELKHWLAAARAASPETRGMMVQGFFAMLLIRAGYAVIVGRRLDIFARGRLRSLLVEVKSSLAGGRFGSRAMLTQLDGYAIVGERRCAEIWLGTMGINRPIVLHNSFRVGMKSRNIGHINIKWILPDEKLSATPASVT